MSGRKRAEYHILRTFVRDLRQHDEFEIRHERSVNVECHYPLYFPLVHISTQISRNAVEIGDLYGSDGFAFDRKTLPEEVLEVGPKAPTAGTCDMESVYAKRQNSSLLVYLATRPHESKVILHLVDDPDDARAEARWVIEAVAAKGISVDHIANLCR